MTKYIFVLLGLFSSTLLFPQSVSEVAAVQLSAVASASPVRITVSWKSLSGTSSITIYRKLKSATSWGSSIASPSPTTNSYIDNGVSVGTAYEYKVVRVSNGVTGTGYLCSGINVPMRDYRGKMILLVANNLASPLSTELLTLEKDLAADGWAVLRTDVTTNTTVSGVRNIIIGHYQSDPSNVKAVYIVGHIAVPYSGNVAPDGHSSHQGAWPCDGYYGEMNGNWTDNSVSVQASQNPKNFNVPGDGKFDQSDFPSALELQVGRVDMYDMPAFSSSEVELTRYYLNKAHTFKVKGYTPNPRAMMFDNLQWVGNPLAASGWRSMAPMVGSEEISAPYQYGPSYNSLVNGQSYLWAYASGGGLQEYIGNEVTFNGADNIGTTQSYAAGNLGGVFNMSFGSYFGDWDNKNNFLRAPLAKGEGLTNAYSSIPGWYFHHMGLGENIGYSTLETMNNTGLYVPLTDGWQGSIGRTHLGLMGDPSLRQKMVSPPTSLSISNSSGTAAFAWTASSEQVAGYYLYQFDATTGAISKVTNTLVTSTSYQNSSIPFQNGKQYMVRAMKMQIDPSGSYENLSLGTIAVSSGVAPPPTTDCAGVVGGTAVPGTTCNDGNACTTNDRWNSSCQCVGVDSTPTASVTPVGSTTFCTGGNVVLNASTGSSYQWKKDGNNISGATSSSYTATTSGTYTVTVSNGSCAATSSGVSVSASSGPSANISAPNGTTFCSGGSAVLNATTGTGFQYVWYRDGSVISGATNVSYTATQAGAYTVRVISGACYTNSSAVTVSVTTSGTASITPVGSTSFCTGGNVVLNASTGSSYQWKKDGNNISGATSSSYTATTSGTYTVTVSNGSCAATSSGVSVSASSGPSANITAPNGTTFCSGGSAVLNATTGTGFQYVWYRNGSAISGATNVSYTATQAGAYTVRVISGACYTNSSAVTVSVTTSGTASITPVGSTSFCTGGNVVLNASTGSSYQWKKDGNNISGATSSSYTATTSGTYTVTVSSGSCAATSSGVSVSASSGPSANITAPNGTTFCSGGSAVLNATTGTGFQYVWYRDGSVISGATNVSYTATQAGAYTVRVISGACYTNSSAVTVSVTTSGTASITPVGSASFCTGGNVVLNASTGSSYQWKKDGNNISGATSSSYTATTSGTYTVTVSNGSCAATSSGVSVSASSGPNANITAPNGTTFCSGGSAVLNATTGTGFQYVWYRNGSAISGATSGSYTATQAGAYTVRVISGACYTNSTAVTVSVTTSGTASITPNGPTTFCTGGSVVLNATSGGTYVWQFNGQNISGATSSSYTATQQGSYKVIVTNGSCSATSDALAVSISTSAPAATISASGPVNLCTGSSVVLSAPTGSTYVWKRNNVTINGATNSNYTVTQGGSYSVTVGTGACASTSSPMNVAVNTPPSAIITATGPTTVCAGQTVALTANTGSGYQFVWKRNGSPVTGATSSAYTATQPGNYTVMVIHGACYTNSAVTSVSMSGSGSASIIPAGPTTFCSGGNVVLNANAGSSYQWMRNGASIDGATSSSYTASVAGSYTVLVGAGSCSGTSSAVTVSVSTVGSASITATGPTTFCTGGNVVLNASAGSSYQWKRNGTSINGATNNSYTATQAGSYTVTVGSGSCAGTSSAVSVSVTSIGTASIAPGSSTSFCTGGSVTLYANTGTGYSYVWRKNGTVINGATASSYTATQGGSYTVAVNAGTCSATSSAIIVTVTNSLSATLFATGPVGFCYGGSVVLAVDGAAGFTYVWKRNGSTIQGASANSYTGTQAGIYTVVVSNGNCSATSNSIQLHVGGQINTNITATQQSGLCSNGGVTLSVPAASGNTYVWRNYGAAISGATSNTYTATASGGYEVSIYNGSCVANSNVVFVNAGSGVNTWIMAQGNTHVCSGDQVVFSTYTAPGLTHAWRRNGVTISGATGSTYAATQNGSYSVRTSNGSCTVTTNAIQAFIAAPLAVTGSPNVGNGTISATATGGEAPYSYLWNTYPAQITQTASINVSGMYSVVVTDVNGCTASANTSIEIGSTMAVEETEDVLAETIEKEDASENIEILVYPNPFRGLTTFSITGLNAEERTTLDVYTIDGVLVANVFTGAVDQQGSYRLTWDASNLKTGMYFYRLISGDRVTSGKLKSE